MAVPVDGSEASQRIFPVAKELARRLPVPVTLIQALESATFLEVGVIDTYSLPRPADIVHLAHLTIGRPRHSVANTVSSFTSPS